MDPAAISALSAVVGSIVGSSATIVTAWISQKTQTKREILNVEIRKREILYAEFITEASRLAIDALDHELESTEKMFTVYALQNRIRLMSSAPVVAATDHALTRIFETYFGPNLTRQQMRELALTRPDDPLRRFAEACRDELNAMRPL
jgi:hypothetical protein